MRCYNGQPDPELQRVLDAHAADDRALRAVHPEAWCTYFYDEEVWRVHIWGTFYGTKSRDRHEAIRSGIEAIRNRG